MGPPLVPALRQQRQGSLWSARPSLVYRGRARTVGAVTQRNSVSENKTTTTKITGFFPGEKELGGVIQTLKSRM